MLHERRFSVNGSGHGDQKDMSLPDRQRKANEAAAGIMDQINERFAEAEKKLKALQPAHDAWLVYHSQPIDQDRPDEWQSNDCIGLVKYHDQWRICYDYYPDFHSGPSSWKPLADCPRSIRVQVASRFLELLPKLRERIVKTTEDFVPKAASALAVLNKAVAQF